MTREPVALAAGIQAAIVALINVANAFGLFNVTDEQLSTLNASLAVVLPLVFALLIRNSVTPVSDPVLKQGTTVTVETPKGQDNEQVVV